MFCKAFTKQMPPLTLVSATRMYASPSKRLPSVRACIKIGQGLGKLFLEAVHEHVGQLSSQFYGVDHTSRLIPLRHPVERRE
jgi:hypothetical protein